MSRTRWTPEPGQVTVSPDRLTPRQWQVLAAFGRGLTAKGVGGVLGMSMHTAEDHRTAYLSRLDVTTTIEALSAVGWLRVPDEP